MASVFAFGLAVVDFVFNVDKLPDAGEKYHTSSSDIIGGGCAANAAVAIRRLGGIASIGTRIGDDIIGTIIKSDLEKYDIDLEYVHRAKNAQSSFSSVAIDSRGERQIVNFRGKGLIEDTEWIGNAPLADAYLADSIWPPGAKATFQLARRHGRPAVADVEALNDPEYLELATHIAFSRQGLLQLTGTSSIIDGLKMVKSRVSAWLCVTDGEHGVYFVNNGAIEFVPAFSICAVDTLGAGDVWHGAFTLRIAEGANELDAILFANATAAIKCERVGGRVNYPTRSEVNTFLLKVS